MLRRSKRNIKSSEGIDNSLEAILPTKKKQKLKDNPRDISLHNSDDELMESDYELMPSSILKLSETESESDDNDSNIIVNNNIKSVPLSYKSSSESEDDTVCETNFDFSAVLNSQNDKKKVLETSTLKINLNNDKEKNNCDILDIATMLCKGEKLKMNPELDDIKDIENDNKQEENYKIPDAVEVIIKLPNNVKCKKLQDMEVLLKRRMNVICKETQVLVHKVNLLLWIFYGNRLNEILNSPEVMSSALSLIPSEKAYPPKQCDLVYLENYINWFSKKIKLASKTDPLQKITVTTLVDQFSNCLAKTRFDLIAMFISMLRSLGLNVRLVINLNAISIKPNLELLGSTNSKDKAKSEKIVETQQKTPSKSEYFKNKHEKSVSKDNNKCKIKRKKTCDQISDSSNEDDKIFVKRDTIKKLKHIKQKVTTSQTKKIETKVRKTSNIKKLKEIDKIDRRVLSTDEEDIISNDTLKNKKNDFWVEVFLEMEEKWFSVDVINKRLHCIKEIYNGTSHPMRYVLAWYNDNSIKEVTKRYDPFFHTLTRKIRVDQKWWESTLRLYKPLPNFREREEDEELDKRLEDIPLPKTVSEYKDHPLYALERHLLKFQAIYPPKPPILGYIRNEPVYSRENVHELNGRENWLKEARVVKVNEQFYKQVKARPRFDKNGVRTDPPPLELFGYWQTEPYDPPTACDGKVPRNCYGNVDLFKPSMLPKGTVHLKLPGLLRIAKKLNIDCAPAVVGFDFHSGGSHPVNDGFVVCEEYKDTLIDAWNQELEESRKREQKRYEDRVYGNWRRLVKAVLIREKLKIKYNYFKNNQIKPSSSKASF
ncbi:DNA repair protein complementing XP-C cells [Daktulosphaira vitifoliae]|uniref:DNA repair protein complementing XP-C cells n=1 Tax=Daktulosphaira vitifoliae TaxID=58002 RepID=UPI0021A9E005|nr:DNA repair protein complementing XP-C cells [Daktulosphaira vitifoliae]XP_050530392.1 DNA repair protein complementing XP-C cells [Daktulosphaira vitifoliae]